MKPPAVRLLSLRALSVALSCVAGIAISQTIAPLGTAKRADYDCSGLDGAALTSCRQLNAAAAGGALIIPDAALSSTDDCAGMSGAALSTCRDPGATTVDGAGSSSAATGTTLPSRSTIAPVELAPLPER
jgi:hypothetical protein